MSTELGGSQRVGPRTELGGAQRIAATAWLLGDRIDTRAVPVERVVSRSPLTLQDGADRLVVLYRFGALVVFAPESGAGTAYPEDLGRFVVSPLPSPEFDTASIRISADEPEGADREGVLVIAEASLERFHVVADVLARSALLAHYESEVSTALDRVEPLAERLRLGAHRGLRGRQLLQELGEVLVSEMRMVGRAEVSEKPERLWDRPRLDALYVRLAEEYELADRDRAVTRKLELLGRATETFLGVLDTRRSLNVEWYIVILILIELFLLVYELATR
ncbi:MAG: RMD1 family protein [Spirochaetaceae bacterium]|nr:RMD1 family protein [Myxococcales bacterium]MCB9723039.1 RMD1 family protein [Spirochaetaceae bacterium]HPG27358.1 RMD1 family protein [Myxococcota bacterium]